MAEGRRDDRERERRADARLARDGQLAAHRGDDPLRDEQAEPGAAVHGLHLLVRAEDVGGRGDVDADARIGDLEQQAPRVAFARRANRQRDRAAAREFRCVGQQVQQHLLQPDAVDQHRARQRRDRLVDEPVVLLRTQRERVVADVVQQPGQVGAVGRDAERLQFGLREREQFVDQRELVADAAVDRPDQPRLAARRALQQQLRIAVDRRQRRAQVVADIAERLDLLLQVRLRLLQRIVERHRAPRDFVAQPVLFGELPVFEPLARLGALFAHVVNPRGQHEQVRREPDDRDDGVRKDVGPDP